MWRLTLLLACTVLLAVNAAAQTAPAKEPVLEIHRFGWFEAAWSTLDPWDGGQQAAAATIWRQQFGPGRGDNGVQPAATGVQPAATMKWRREHAPGRGDYGVTFVLKNVTRKPIKSVNLGFVFRDAATDRVFLTYNLRFDRRIGPGEKKELRHIIKKGQEPNNFSPAAPTPALLEYTKSCGDNTYVFDRKRRKLVKLQAGEINPNPLPCTARPAVTRIDYEDGTFWQP